MECVFISGGCNAVYSGFDYCQFEPNTHLIAYPCSNQVLIYDVDKVTVIESYPFFTRRVNCIRYLTATSWVAGDGDGNLIVVENKQLKHKNELGSSIQQLSASNGSIVCLTIDGQIRILDYSLVQQTSIDFKNNVMEAVDMINHLGKTFIALSGVDQFIHIYDDQFNFIKSLKGHQRSVNSLKFQSDGEDLLLASGSKDTFTRIWRISNNEITLDTILQGHGEEVSSVNWKDSKTIATASFDYNILIWTYQDNLWINTIRLGQTHGNKNQIFGVQYSKDRQSLCAYSLIGAFYLFKAPSWEEQPTISGHYGPVKDIDLKDYLVSCSHDQTTRIYSKWIKNGSYHEVSRPQVHGYDMNAVVILNDKIVSGADEKILRIFKQSFFTVNQLNYLSDAQLKPDGPFQLVGDIREYQVNEGIQQALGLMNVQDIEDDFPQENYNPTIKYGTPPSDALLVAKSLWPEINKLYGHGYAISSIATNGTIVASSSLAITEKAAEIIIWNLETFKIQQQLACHQYTIVQLVFSKNRYLCSVSKDRCLGLFEQIDGQFILKSKSVPCGRIVYGAAFSDDEQFIYTCSRDKKFRIYKTENAIQPIKEIEFAESITAVESFQNFIVLGFANGNVSLYQLNDLELNLVHEVASLFKHSQEVNRIKYHNGLIATCSNDHTVRIFKI